MVMIPAAYGAPAIAPSKLEERSPISADADYGRDRLRILQSELDRFKLESSLKNLEREQPTTDFANLVQALGQLRAQEGAGTQALAGENRQLHDDINRLMQEVIAARSEAALKDLEGRLGQQIGVLASRLEHHSERLEELRFWAGMAKEAPEIVGDIVDKTEGRIIERLSHVASAGGMKVGGLWGEPHDVRPITFPSRKVLTIDRAKATEVMPIPDEQMEGMERVIAQQLQDDPKSHPYSVDIREQSRRELLLAEELAKTRRELEEVRARKSPPPPVSPVDMPRKVIRATQEAEPNVG